MTLRELAIGDRFTHANSKAKNPTVFMKKGKCEFNRAHGSSTCECWMIIDPRNARTVSKSCNLEVKLLTGEQQHLPL